MARRSEAKATLRRTTFEISREIEYFSEKELQRQVGHGKAWWPISLVKELVDNSLDACEVGEIRPEIEVEVNAEGFSVRDSGPGISPAVIEGSLDFLKRVSDKTFYVSPTRGQLGNALKVVWAAPYVAHGQGRVEVETGGCRHVIECSLDEIAQRPRVVHEVEQGHFVQNGTLVRVAWPDSATSEEGDTDDDGYHTYSGDPPTPQELVEGYAALNPHATLRLGDLRFRATDPGFQKWRCDEPTSAHWYTPATLRDLIAAYLVKERQDGRRRTVRELVSEFRGLSRSMKQKRAVEGLSRVYLQDLVEGGRLDDGAIVGLLERMKEQSKPVQPRALGAVGQDHLAKWMVAHADVAAESIKYHKAQGFQDGLPHIVEVALGVRNDDEAVRRVIYGMNWAPALVNPVRETAALLQEYRIDPHDPVVVVVHMVRPRWDFTDHGKSRVQL